MGSTSDDHGDLTKAQIRAQEKFWIKENLGVLLKFFVFANLELVSCEVYFPEKENSEKLIVK